MPFIVATYVSASSQGQRTHSAQINCNCNCFAFQIGLPLELDWTGCFDPVLYKIMTNITIVTGNYYQLCSTLTLSFLVTSTVCAILELFGLAIIGSSNVK